MLEEPASDDRACTRAAAHAATADVVAALAGTTSALTIEDLWPDALDIAVDPTLAKTDSVERTHQRALRHVGGRFLLQLIWKESKFVSAANLQKLGGTKCTTPTKLLTCHGLAVVITEDTAEFAAQCKRVAKLVAAAEHYELVTVTPAEKGNKNIIEATELLHNVMMNFGDAVHKLMAAGGAKAD